MKPLRTQSLKHRLQLRCACCGDLVLGDESLGNKAMDAGFMAGGAALGSVVPVVGTALGATGGKMLSDGIQFLVGGGKSDRERQLEELLASRGAI